MRYQNAFTRRKLRNRTKTKKVNVGRLRLSFYRSNKYIYAQIIDDVESTTLVSASSFEVAKAKAPLKTASLDAAKLVGKMIAERALTAKCTSVYLDRSGYAYHGKVKAFADAAREHGLVF